MQTYDLDVIHDLLRIGRLDLALESFLLLYYHIGRLDAWAQFLFGRRYCAS